MEIEIGQVLNIRPEVVAATPGLANHRQAHVRRIVPTGEGTMLLLADTDGKRIGWFRASELTAAAVHGARIVHSGRAETPITLSQQVDQLTTRVDALAQMTAAPLPNVESEVLQLARARGPQNDLAVAVQRVLADPKHAALAEAWKTRHHRQAPTGPAQEDVELTALARARQAAGVVSFRQALLEVSRERRDLTERFVEAIHGRRDGHDDTGPLAAAAQERATAGAISFRDALRDVSHRRVDLARRFERVRTAR